MAATTRTPRPRRTLTPVDVTARYPSLRSGRLEAWSAVSDDGVWKYERLEEIRTPWSIQHVPSGIEVGTWAGTLSEAREMTANGTAQADVELQMAHQRGEHDAERDPGCVKCS
jgi:hypothetical protein